MSFSTCSWEHPTAAVATPEAPSTFKNARRLTPVDSLMRDEPSLGVQGRRSVVTHAAIVARAFRWSRDFGGSGGDSGEPGAFSRLVAVHVTVHAPPHVQRGILLDDGHVLDRAVTRLAGDPGVDVPHMWESDVVGQLVDANPRNGCLRDVCAPL